MNVANAIRKVYEQRPYPNLPLSTTANARWRLPPLPWIRTILQWQHPPHRILIAGCGSGSEAFAFRRRFPDAEIVAVDFSPKSIRAAKDLQRNNRKFRTIRFILCDLTSSRFSKIVGDNFDFISCHGVLSYVPRVRQVLRNFARCLASDGALYLGVNGTTHYSEEWRQVLPGFGVKVDDFQDTRSLRRLLKLFDVLSGHRSGFVASRNSGYLAGDLFGPLIQNWPLTRWARLYRAAGLHLLGSYSIFLPLRAVFHDQSYRSLMPRSRAEVVELFEMLRPSGFHRLILSRRRDLRPPWKDLGKLRNWRPVLTRLYHPQWPQKSWRLLALRNLKLKSPTSNTLVELRTPGWQIELLRRSNGEGSINDILRPVAVGIAWDSLRDQLYLLHQLGVINLLPPAS